MNLTEPMQAASAFGSPKPLGCRTLDGVLCRMTNEARNLGLTLHQEKNLQSYWTTTKLRKLTVVLDYWEAMETYSRIGLLRS
jgi:hypothetical protein